MDCQNLVFSRHAIQQMFYRRISQKDVKTAISYGEVIEENPDDTPYPSYLILDFIEGKPIHVVFSYDEATDTGYVVTAYIPDTNIWLDGFTTRRQR
ncbi:MULTISPECIES: DUF4258 domain-containing protein [Nostoc]|uniref:DUF4258 domain-containing protein n=2 Tax=Nostoc TaxID=1177 RepID=A0ABR8IHM2_9NOSO|nr:MULTISPECIES: DUF4258 domain-containing protein [Nostoc]MBD2565066.1 DUF4258 domain-containing protein [Nostoc linckia FACHB-391]MBD2650683.1 DUF4258 domain-containing protein [Nostoc foliaceum FACHB-393]